jgi:ribulose-5-phosphate 4-epimerase/fuculose-1-phosphate aldolase
MQYTQAADSILGVIPLSYLTAELRQEILDACRILTHFRMVEAFGHVSTRLPGGEHIAITPRIALALVQPEDIAVLRLDGEQVEGRTPKPLESAMHLAVYRRRPDVQALCRAHPRHVAAFAAAAEPLRCAHGFGANLGAVVPVTPEPVLVVSEAQADLMAETLGAGDAVIVRSSGMLAVGQSVPHAVVRALWLEEMAEVELLARAGGLRPAYFTPEQVTFRRGTDEVHEPVRAWDYYRAVALGELP